MLQVSKSDDFAPLGIRDVALLAIPSVAYFATVLLAGLGMLFIPASICFMVQARPPYSGPGLQGLLVALTPPTACVQPCRGVERLWRRRGRGGSPCAAALLHMATCSACMHVVWQCRALRCSPPAPRVVQREQSDAAADTHASRHPHLHCDASAALRGSHPSAGVSGPITEGTRMNIFKKSGRAL